MLTKSATVHGPTILLRSGSYFDFTNPEQSDFTAQDIAHGLSNICRFTGQCERFYSVAEHCVHASRYVEGKYALDALMHDAPEAFIGDVSKPLKEMMPDYKAIEKRVESAVFKRFKVQNPLPAAVKDIDLVMLVTEQHQLMNNKDNWAYAEGRKPLNIELPCWSPEEAKKQFLDRLTEIWGWYQ